MIERTIYIISTLKANGVCGPLLRSAFELQSVLSEASRCDYLLSWFQAVFIKLEQRYSAKILPTISPDGFEETSTLPDPLEEHQCCDGLPGPELLFTDLICQQMWIRKFRGCFDVPLPQLIRSLQAYSSCTTYQSRLLEEMLNNTIQSGMRTISPIQFALSCLLGAPANSVHMNGPKRSYRPYPSAYNNGMTNTTHHVEKNGPQPSLNLNQNLNTSNNNTFKKTTKSQQSKQDFLPASPPISPSSFGFSNAKQNSNYNLEHLLERKGSIGIAAVAASTEEVGGLALDEDFTDKGGNILSNIASKLTEYSECRFVPFFLIWTILEAAGSIPDLFKFFGSPATNPAQPIPLLDAALRAYSTSDRDSSLVHCSIAPLSSIIGSLSDLVTLEPSQLQTATNIKNNQSNAKYLSKNSKQNNINYSTNLNEGTVNSSPVFSSSALTSQSLLNPHVFTIQLTLTQIASDPIFCMLLASLGPFNSLTSSSISPAVPPAASNSSPAKNDEDEGKKDNDSLDSSPCVLFIPCAYTASFVLHVPLFMKSNKEGSKQGLNSDVILNGSHNKVFNNNILEGNVTQSSLSDTTNTKLKHLQQNNNSSNPNPFSNVHSSVAQRATSLTPPTFSQVFRHGYLFALLSSLSSPLMQSSTSLNSLAFIPTLLPPDVKPISTLSPIEPYIPNGVSKAILFSNLQPPQPSSCLFKITGSPPNLPGTILNPPAAASASRPPNRAFPVAPNPPDTTIGNVSQNASNYIRVSSIEVIIADLVDICDSIGAWLPLLMQQVSALEQRIESINSIRLQRLVERHSIGWQRLKWTLDEFSKRNLKVDEKREILLQAEGRLGAGEHTIRVRHILADVSMAEEQANTIEMLLAQMEAQWLREEDHFQEKLRLLDLSERQRVHATMQMVSGLQEIKAWMRRALVKTERVLYGLMEKKFMTSKNMSSTGMKYKALKSAEAYIVGATERNKTGEASELVFSNLNEVLEFAEKYAEATGLNLTGASTDERCVRQLQSEVWDLSLRRRNLIVDVQSLTKKAAEMTRMNSLHDTRMQLEAQVLNLESKLDHVTRMIRTGNSAGGTRHK